MSTVCRREAVWAGALAGRRDRCASPTRLLPPYGRAPTLEQDLTGEHEAGGDNGGKRN